ncbi:MAG: sodium-dependent transporter, partial [Enterococcus sp.]|nr:sodium-dependent transporter [Enterococcus sp.]
MASIKNSQSKRASWSGRTAFIFSAAASAVGLGNFWRFPYLEARYGGGTFLITFVVIVFTVGVSLLVLEISLGRKTRMSTIEAFAYFGKKYKILGLFASLSPFMICSYYCVVGGWVVKYIWAYIWDDPSVIGQQDYFSNFCASSFESLIFVLIFLIIGIFVVAKGVKKGIERANNILMPALIILSFLLAIWVVCQPGALQGVQYFFTPDFSKFSVELVMAAITQTFFALSLGLCIMVTYGSYLDKKTPLVRSARIIS